MGFLPIIISHTIITTLTISSIAKSFSSSKCCCSTRKASGRYFAWRRTRNCCDWSSWVSKRRIWGQAERFLMLDYSLLRACIILTFLRPKKNRRTFFRAFLLNSNKESGESWGIWLKWIDIKQKFISTQVEKKLFSFYDVNAYKLILFSIKRNNHH